MKQRGLISSSERQTVLRNGVFGLLEYLAQPLGILLAAPYLMRRLGAAQFGIWVLASAAVNSGNLISSSFGDATIRYVSLYRGRRDISSIERSVRATLAINLALSGLGAVAMCALAPLIAARVVRGDTSLQLVCSRALQVGAVLLVVRSIDSVLGCTLRAFERYAPAVWIASCFRFGVLAAAVALAATGRGVVDIMLATLALAALSAVLQGAAVRVVAGRILLLPSFERAALREIVGFGSFSWLQAIGAVAFGQADRLVVGMMLGAPAVALYGLCAQIAQAIHGSLAAGLHVIFPHLSRRFAAEPLFQIRSSIFAVAKINIAGAAVAGTVLVIFSRTILSHWMGPAFASQARTVFVVLSIAFALFAMNVTAHYALLALGRVRLVTAVNLTAGFAMLGLMFLLAPGHGLLGAAAARLITGPITCLLYLTLRKQLRAESRAQEAAAAHPAWENV